MRSVIGVGLSVALHGLIVAIAVAWLPTVAVRETPEPGKGRVAFDVTQGRTTETDTAAATTSTTPNAGGRGRATTQSQGVGKAERADKTRRPARTAAEPVAVAGAETAPGTGAVAETAAGPEAMAGSASASESGAPGPGASSTGRAADLPSAPAPDPSAIHSAIARVVRYPRLARSQRLEGQVIVRFHIDAAGAPSDLGVVTSAGDLLDAAAREAVLRAAPYQSPPGWVRVPVIFSLHDVP